jgi:tetraprenyl-beta-curcumene synthase
VTRACVAFEVLYDFLDALGEAHPTLEDNRRLHAALTAAVAVGHAAPDARHFYGRRWGDDGGYLDALVTTCRRELAGLPSAGAVARELRALTAPAGEAQSRNHALLSGDVGLRSWAERAAANQTGIRWFEFAAGAGSPLSMFALMAAASHGTTSATDARAIADAYFPWVAALHWLLESVVDQADDEATGNPSYVSHYGSAAAAAARLAAIARHSARDLRDLPDARRHLLLLAGMVALNLVQADGANDVAREVTPPVRQAIGPAIAPFTVMLRLRARARRLGRFRRR